MHLYSKVLAEITWADVEDFCQQKVTEGATLDYKRAFPNDLERTIAAMANTLGGLILLGVAEDEYGKPVTPVEGMPFERGIAERILSISSAAITPPVVPAVQLCLNSTGTRAVAVIRVPQSHEAPHAIAANARVYVRTGQRNDPDELANLDRLTWLMANREKSESFREWLTTRANYRFNTLTMGLVPTIAPTLERHGSGVQMPCLLTISIVPNYPTAEPLAPPQQLNVIRRKITVKDRMGTANEFPIQEGDVTARLVEDGVIMHSSGGMGLRAYHTHLNMHGLYLFKQSLLYELSDEAKAVSGEAPKVFMRAGEIIERTYAMLASGGKFYGQLGYFGPLRLRLRLENVLKWPLRISPTSEGGLVYRYSADPEVDVIELCSVAQLESDANSLVYRLVRRIGWAFDWDFADGDVERLRPS